MTKPKIVYLIVGLALVALLAGCGDGAFGDKGPKAEAEKKVINTYLEGLRDHNYDKLKETVTYSVYSSWPTERSKFKEMLTEQQKPIGAIKSWKLEENPYVDEINNQALVNATVTTERYLVILKFDLRKQGDRWRVYGVETVKKIPRSTDKEGNTSKDQQNSRT